MFLGPSWLFLDHVYIEYLAPFGTNLYKRDRMNVHYRSSYHNDHNLQILNLLRMFHLESVLVFL